MTFKRKAGLFLAILTICAACLGFGAAAVQTPEITANAAILVDMASGEALFEKNADIRLKPASITKLMTALIAAESCGLDEVVTVTAPVFDGLIAAGSSMGLREGEEIKLEYVLYGLIVASGNDAANALAVHVSGSVPAFVERMNARAQELGCTGTHFENAHGLDAEGHETTARDIFLIAEEFLKHDKLAEISNTVSFVVPPTNKYSSQRVLSTTNYLIRSGKDASYLYSPAVGVKTGTTKGAGFCLVSSAKKNGMHLVSVVMGAKEDPNTGKIMSFVETKDLFEWGFRNFSTKTLVRAGDPVVEVPVDMAQDRDSVTAVLQESLEYMLPNDFAPGEVVITPWLESESLEAPVIKGQVLGEADISYGGTSYGRIKLVALTGVERSDFLHMMDNVKNFTLQPVFRYILIGAAAAAALYFVILVLLNRRRRLRRLAKKGKYIR